MQSLIASNGVPYLQISSVGSHRTCEKRNKGVKGRSIIIIIIIIIMLIIIIIITPDVTTQSQSLPSAAGAHTHLHTERGERSSNQFRNGVWSAVFAFQTNYPYRSIAT